MTTFPLFFSCQNKHRRVKEKNSGDAGKSYRTSLPRSSPEFDQLALIASTLQRFCGGLDTALLAFKVALV